MMKKNILRRLILIGLTLYLTGCGAAGGNALKFSGTVELTEHSVGTRVPGRIVDLRVSEGDTVTTGQVLAVLDRYAQVKKDLERLKGIFKEGGVDQQTIERAELDLGDQEVVSPVDGVVLLKVREAGEVAQAGAPIVVIGEDKDPWVRIFVPEGVVNRVRMGQGAQVRPDGIKRSFKGHVVHIAPKAEFTPRNVQTQEERVTQTFAVKVAVEGADGQIHPGVFADVTLEPVGS